MRSSWTGSLSASLLSFPVKMGPAANDNDLKLFQVRKSDSSRIKYKRVAEADGQEVPWAEIGKGFDPGDGNIVVLEDSDFEAAFGKTTRDAEIITFTEAGNIPRIAAQKSYLLQPGKGGERVYALLYQALSATQKVAVVKFAIGQRKRLATVYAAGNGYLVIEQLLYDSEIRRPDFDAPTADVSEAELNMAIVLVNTMSSTYAHEEQADDSTERLREIITAKLEGSGNTPEIKAVDGREAVGDLVGALKAAIEKSRGKSA